MTTQGMSDSFLLKDGDNTLQPILPTVVHSMENWVKVEIYGKPYHWGIWQDDDGQSNQTLERISRILRVKGINSLYMPYVSNFNALLCKLTDFTQQLEFSGITFHHGVSADALVLESDYAIWLTSADCPTIIALDVKSGLTFVAHAGFKSLFDFNQVVLEQEPRPFFSVIDTLLDAFEKHDSNIADLRFHKACGIGPLYYTFPVDHTVYGQQNVKLVQYLINTWGEGVVLDSSNTCGIDLFELITAQLMDHHIGVNRITTDAIDTYGDTDFEFGPKFWSHRRGSNGRNGVLVYRTTS